jgi:hypothetical protein
MAFANLVVITYVKSASLLHLLLLSGNWAHTPPPGVKVTLHNDALNLSNNTVVA